jgi:hypothetical protein
MQIRCVVVAGLSLGSLDVFDGNIDIGFDPNTAKIDAQFRSNRLRPVNGSFRGGLKHVNASSLKAPWTRS